MAEHVPALASRADGTWGVYCLACSDREQDYVYPCRRLTSDRVPYYPPRVLHEKPKEPGRG